MNYTTISIEGGLFPPDLLERIPLGDGGIKGQATGDFGLPPSRRPLDEMQRSFSDARKYWDAFSRRLERSRESRTTLTREVWMAGLFELLGFLPLEYQRAGLHTLWSRTSSTGPRPFGAWSPTAPNSDCCETMHGSPSPHTWSSTFRP